MGHDRGVNATLDALFDSDLHIAAELVLEVELCLLAQSARFRSFKRVTSHPQPLGQCKQWLRAHLPKPSWSRALTTSAAQDALKDHTLQPSASPRGRARPAGVRERNSDHEATRRASSWSQTAHGATGNDKTTRGFHAARARALRRVLEVFDGEGLNLTRIERGRARQLGIRLFTDLEGHRDDPRRARPRRLQKDGAMVRVSQLPTRAEQSSLSVTRSAQPLLVGRAAGIAACLEHITHRITSAPETSDM